MRLAFGLLGLMLASPAWAGPDLAIGDDEVYRRPNSWSLQDSGSAPYQYAASRTGVSIAWRNADQVEEVEVRVVNLGDATGRGKVSVDVVNAEGRILLHLQPPEGEEVISVPPTGSGGSQGKIIRMKASWELNGMIDRFDLNHTQYGVMATVEPIGPDNDLSNNRKTKTWNNMSRVVPGGLTTFNYDFVNAESQPRVFTLKLERSRLPQGWQLIDSNAQLREVTLQPNDHLRGTLSLQVPSSTPSDGAFSEARIALVDRNTNSVYRQHEWFEIYDSTPPSVSNYRAILLPDHTIAIQALVADEQSGVLEATGVKTEYSLDGGKTWAQRAHNYKTGNFIRPTLFETVLGPFAPGTEILLRFSAMDTAGNVTAAIPADAQAFAAPSGAQQLLQLAYVFPRTKPNPIFNVEELRALTASIKSAQARGQDVRRFSRQDLSALGIPADRLAALGVDAARFADLKSDLYKLGLLDLPFDQIQPVAIEHAKAPGDGIIALNTIKFTVR